MRVLASLHRVSRLTLLLSRHVILDWSWNSSGEEFSMRLRLGTRRPSRSLVSLESRGSVSDQDRLVQSLREYMLRPHFIRRLRFAREISSHTLSVTSERLLLPLASGRPRLTYVPTQRERHWRF